MRLLRHSYLFVLLAILLVVLAVRYLAVEGGGSMDRAEIVSVNAAVNLKSSARAAVNVTDSEVMTVKAQQNTDLISSSSNEALPTHLDLSEPSMDTWLRKGEELVRFESTHLSPGKQRTVRLLRTDFKYPYIRVEESSMTGLAAGSESVQREQLAMVGDHLTVSLKAGTDLKAFTSVLAAMDMEIRDKLDENTFIVAFEPSMESDTLVEKQQSLTDYSDLVAYVEPDYIVQSHAVPTDPSLLDSGQLWGLYNDGRYGGSAESDIDAENGWNIRKDAPNTIVAVIDTGVRRTHEKLAPNMWTNSAETINGIDQDGNGYVDDFYGFDAYDDDMDPLDLVGHGTHVAGIIGASGYNAGGILGVAWNVQIMALRFLGPDGFGTTSDAVRCIDYARRNGARVLNNSWGGSGKSLGLQAAIERCEAANILFVASAGNSNVDIDVQPSYPAAYPNRNIVTVAAHDRKDQAAFFTNRGFQKVDISAPGVDIRSAAFFTDDATKRLSGTSMAAPFVSGVLALLDAEFSGSNTNQLLNRLYRGAGLMGAKNRHISQSGGRVDLFGSLTTTLDTPANDNFSDAYQLEGRSWAAWEVDARGATFEVDEPTYTRPVYGTGSLWFSFDTGNANALRVSTEGSEFPVEVFVFDSETRELLSASNGRSRFYFLPEISSSYHFAVVNTTANSGLVALDIRQSPVNDSRAHAFEQEGLLWETSGENGGASLDFDEFSSWGFAPVDRSVWWQWVAPRDGRFTLSTHGSDFDTVLAAFSGDASATLKEDTTHLLFAIDRSKAVQKKYNVIFGYDANRDGGSADVLDHQIAGIISALQYWQSENKSKNGKWQNLQVGILVFDENTEVCDVNPATAEVELWTGITADADSDGQSDLIQALRSIRSSELEVDFGPVLESANELLEVASKGEAVIAVFSPAQGLVESDFSGELTAFHASGQGLSAFAPTYGSDIEALSELDPYVRSYSHYWEVRGMLRGMLAVNDDASWYGRWSQVTITAKAGERYYFGVAGYQGEYGAIQLEGRDPDYPFIVTEPVSTTTGISERATLEVTATGQEPLIYQWYLNDELLAGANSRSYAVWSALPSDAGRYRVEVSNVHGQAVSRTVRLDLTETAPRLTFQPSDTGFIENESLRLLGAAVGTEPITWQWYHNDAAIPNATDAVLNIANADASTVGSYYCIATNPIGSTRSRTVEATITSAEFSDWNLRAGNFDEADLMDVTFGNDTFVAVGSQSKVLYTDDVVTWRAVELDVESDLKGVAFGNGIFVAAGSGDTVLRGSSPHNLELVDLGGSTDWNGVDYVDGVFWLTGDNGQLLRSRDGESWETITTGTDAALIGITYGHDGYLVISNSNVYVRSFDAINWSAQIAESNNPSRPAVAFRAVAYFSGRYYLCLNGVIQNSGTTELAALSTTTSSTLAKFHALTLDDQTDHLVAVGGYSSYLGSYLYGVGGRGSSGLYRISGSSPSALGSTYGLGYYVTVGAGGQIYRSTDGQAWQSGWEITKHTLKDILYANGVYVASGNKGAVYTSPDGQWWQQVRGEVDRYGAAAYRDIWTHVIEHQGEIYVLSPEGNHGKSSDGLHWEWFSGVGHNRVISDGTYFYFGNGSNLYRSADMQTLIEKLLPDDTARDILDLAYGDGLFVLRTYKNSADVLWTSSDGLTWTKAGSSGSTADMLVHQDGIFLGNDMRWSEDGIHWEKAGLLTRVDPADAELSYHVPTKEVINWASSGINYDDVWVSAPTDTLFGYDTAGALSFTLPDVANLEASMHNQASSLYIRYQLEQFVPEDYLSLTLKTRFNDGLLIYIDNTVVAGENAAESASWNSLATGAKTVAEAETEQIFDLSASLDHFETVWYDRMIAFHVLNRDVADGLFFFDFELVGLKRLTLENVFAADGTFFGFNEDGELFVSENARDWVRFQPEVGVLRSIIKDLDGFTGVGERGTVFQTGDAAHLAPQVYLREPLVAQSVGIGDPVHMEIDAYASEGGIQEVQIFANEQLIATLTEAPYTFDWVPESFGTFEVYVVATDGLDAASRSTSVDISVTAHLPWRAIGHSPAPSDLNSLQRIGDQWAALSTAGRIYFSDDGLTWTQRSVPAQDTMQSIAVADDGTLVAGSAEGGVFTSYDDGRNWIEQARFLNFDLSSIYYSFGRFYFAANGVLIASSTDYQSWEIEQQFVADVTYATNGYFAFGDGKLMLAIATEAYVSEDGESWTLYGSIPSPTGLAYREAEGDFLVAYSKRVKPSYSYVYEGALARVVAGQVAEEILVLPYYEGYQSYETDRSEDRIHFSASGNGLFIGPRASSYDASTGLWTDAATVSIHPSGSDERIQVRSKALTSVGDEFYILDEFDRLLRSTDGLVWETLDGEPVNRWQAIRYLNGHYLAIGLGGGVYSSVDAENWTLHATGSSARLYDVSYGAGRYVVAADNGQLLVSTDLETWSLYNTGVPGDLKAVRFADGRFVAAGVDCTFRSSDGLVWENSSPVYEESVGEGFNILSVQFWEGKWFLIGSKYLTNSSGIRTLGPLYYISEDDASTWTTGTNGDDTSSTYDAYSDLVYANGTYLMVEYGTRMHTSTDLVNWTMVTTGEGYKTKRATYVDGYWYVMCSGGQLIRSSDTVEWETVMSAQGGVTDYYAAGAGVAAGPEGLLIANGVERILHSTDGSAWTPVFEAGGSTELVAAAHDEGSFYAVSSYREIMEVQPGSTAVQRHQIPVRSSLLVQENGLYFAFGGDNELAVSSDGETWTSVDFSGIGAATDVLDVIHDGSQYLAIANVRFTSTQTAYVLTSPDGYEWSLDEDLEAPYGNSYHTIDMSYVDGAYYAGGLLRSTDFVTWTAVNTSSSRDASFGYVNGLYLCSGFYSYDGIHWLECSGWGGATAYAYTNGVYLATSGEVVYVSEDGISWSVTSTGGIVLMDVFADEDGFVALAADGSTHRFSLNDLAPSATNWTQETYGPGETVEGSFTLTNYGKEDWAGQVAVDYEIWMTESGRLFDATSQLVESGTWQGSLAVGQSASIAVSILLPDDQAAGSYYSAVVLDPLSLVADYNQDNNNYTSPLADLVIPEWSVDFEITGGGTLMNAAPDASGFRHNTTETFVPMAEKGYIFTGWEGVDDPGLGPLTLNFDQNYTIQAMFEQAYQLSTSVSGRGTVDASPGGEQFAAGSTVLLTAQAEAGWRFEKWTGDAEGSENPYTWNVDDHASIRAHFIPDGGESFAAWIDSRAPTTKQGPNEDGLGNGRPNLLNYFLGQNSADSAPVAPVLVPTPVGYDFKLPVNPDAQGVGFEVLYSRDLVDWYPLETALIRSMDGENELSYEIVNPSHTALFFTVRVYQLP